MDPRADDWGEVRIRGVGRAECEEAGVTARDKPEETGRESE